MYICSSAMFTAARRVLSVARLDMKMATQAFAACACRARARRHARRREVPLLRCSAAIVALCYVIAALNAALAQRCDVPPARARVASSSVGRGSVLSRGV